MNARRPECENEVKRVKVTGLVLEDLPMEILCYIARFADFKDVENMRRTSKTIRNKVSHSNVWGNIGGSEPAEASELKKYLVFAAIKERMPNYTYNLYRYGITGTADLLLEPQIWEYSYNACEYVMFDKLFIVIEADCSVSLDKLNHYAALGIILLQKSETQLFGSTLIFTGSGRPTCNGYMFKSDLQWHRFTIYNFRLQSCELALDREQSNKFIYITSGKERWAINKNTGRLMRHLNDCCIL